MLGVVSASNAQNRVAGTVKGKLADSTKKESLADATVSVLNPRDSSIVSYTLANAKGEFEIKDLDTGVYRLVVSFQGYDPYTKTFMISRDFPVIDLNTIYLDRKGTTLEAVVVEAAPIQVKGDTTEFRASAFKVKPNANAEDVLKKIPGMQVDKDGNVKAQGEDVQKVYVDGKEFFGTDPKLATKNITADMIESIQVFDDMSDQAKFTKIDDGSRSKTINIKLKKDKRKGYFGRFMLGGGTDERYESSLSFNKFNGDERISILGGSNNVNKQTFSFSDIVGSMGGFGSRGGGGGGGGRGGGMSFGGFGGGRSGINRATNAGINYANKFGTKVDLSASYFFSDSKTRNESSSLSSTLGQFPSDPELIGTENRQSKSDGINQNHRFNMRMEYFIDSSNSLLLTPTLTFQHSETNSFDTSYTYASKESVNYLANQGSKRSYSERDGMSFNNNTLFRHKFSKIGRTITIGWNTSYQKSDGNGTTLAPYSYYFPDGNLDSIRYQNQASDQSTNSFNNTVSASYTEPIGLNKLLEFNYAYTVNQSKSDRETYDYNINSGKFDAINEIQTNYFENDFKAHRVGLNFRVQNAKYNYQLGGAIQQAELVSRSTQPDGSAPSGVKETNLSNKYINFFPTANFQYNIKRGMSIFFRYNGRTNQPSSQQLQDVRDESNQQQIYIGNPGLQQEFSNNFNIRFNSFDAATFRYFNFSINAGNTYNKIVNSLKAIGAGVQEIRPVNLNGAFNGSTFFTLGLPLRKLKGSNLNFNNSIRYNRDISLINEKENTTNTLTISQTAGINLDFNQKLNLGVNASLTYNKATNSTLATNNTKYYAQTYSTDISYLGLKNWVLSTDFDYIINTGLGQGFNQTVPLWNASIAHQVLKARNAEIKFSVNDLLNQNQSVSRSVSSYGTVDTRTLVLKRYFLLTFTYNLSKGQRQQNTMQMPRGMERQMERQFRRN